MPPDPPPLEAQQLLTATIRDLAPAFMQASNLGESDDRADLYWLIDYLAFAVDQAYPLIPCSGGCSECCTNQVFRVTGREWAIVKRGIAKLGPAARTRLLTQVHAIWGPYRAPLEAVAAAWSAGAIADPELHKAMPSGCPMLVEGRCSIYADRPGMCRGFGYFSAAIGARTSMLMCHQRGPDWLRYLESTGVEQLPMPSWNPVQRKLEALSAGQPVRPMPLWLLDEPFAPSA